jgi:hypothetical protein
MAPMGLDRHEGARSAAVMFSGLMLTTVTVLMAVSLRHADVWTALRWGAVYFACVIAPALVAWLTWRRLTRYMPFVPLPVKRLLLNAAGVYILLGFLALLFAIDGL